MTRPTTLQDLHRRAARLGIHGDEVADLLHDLEDVAKRGGDREALEARAGRRLPPLLAGIAAELVLQELDR